MTRSKLASLVFGISFLKGFSNSAIAAECDYSWVLASTDGCKPSAEPYAEKERRERECIKRLADQKAGGASARTRLKAEFKVDASKLRDSQAIARLEQETNALRQAEEEAQARRASIAEAQQATREGRLMDEQSQMLKRLGVTLEEADENEEGEEDGVDPTELKMYQEMLKNGLAPGCKGKQNEALIDCVDAVLDSE